MIIAALPRFEELRLADLEVYDLLDTVPEKEFDELRELAAQICNCPVSLITLVDKDRQWFKSRQQMEEPETPRDFAFCAHAILQKDVMIVENAAKDERFFDNPLVKGPLQIRFYAGAPIVSPTGQNLGTICVIDQKPRVLSKEQERALAVLSNQITKLLELRLKSKLIEKRAQDIIRMNEESAIEFIKKKDTADLFIAKELHEHIAQDLATVQLYLSMLKTEEASNENQPLYLAKESLSQVITKVKELSYSYSPSTLASFGFHHLLENFIDSQKDSSVRVALEFTGDGSSVSFLQSIGCIRVIEEWLTVLSKQEGISQVFFNINITDDIQVIIKDDAPGRSFEEKEKDILQSLYYRIIGMNGRLRFVESPAGMNELHIQLPIVKSEVTVAESI